MREEEKAVKTIAEFVVNKILEMTKNLSYDRSIVSKITKVLGNGRYEITYGGVKYSPKALNNTTYVVGDNVMITFLQGSFSNSIIIGKVVV